MFDQHPLDHVRQRKVRQHAVIRAHRQAPDACVQRPSEIAEAVHHPLGHAGRARGVNQGGQFVPTTLPIALQRWGVFADLLPAGIGLDGVGWRQWIAQARHPNGNTWLHLFPAVEFADETGFGLAVREDLVDGCCCQRRVQRHRNVASHPDRQIAHDPPAAIFGQDCDLGAGLPALRLQVVRHPAHLIGHLAPGGVLDHTATHRLGKRDAVWRGLLPVIQTLQGQHLRCHFAHGVSSVGQVSQTRFCSWKAPLLRHPPRHCNRSTMPRSLAHGQMDFVGA